MATKMKQQQSDVFAKIAAVNTLLERYPVLTTTDPMLTNFSINTSIGFILSILEICGISQTDIVYWLCNTLDDGDGGLLVGIEYAVKGILMANIKNVLSCNFNPILPDNLMKYVVDDHSGRQDPSADIPFDPDKKNCIEINLQSIDLFGLLANCPSHKKGGIFYFDAFDPSHITTVDGKDYEEANYLPNELYKSRDFNAFLWYVINKGNITNHIDMQKNTWDNRNKVYKKWHNKSTGEDDATIKDNFFKTVTWEYANYPKIPIYKDSTKVLDKEQYIICQYSEHGNTEAYSNVLKVWLNADRYYRTRNFKVPVAWDENKQPTEWHTFGMNKTVFEFNYDYIFSLKLFDTKTLVANIINSLLGLASSLSVSFSFEQKQLQKKVEAMVETIMSQDDTGVAEDCYYKFDNSMYQQMIDEVTRSYKGAYVDPLSSYNENFDDVYDAIGALGKAAEKAGQAQLLNRVIQITAAKKEDNPNNGISGGVGYDWGFNVGADFITEFIKQTVVQIVLQVLSPKVGVLYAINSQLLGDVSDLREWEEFIKNFDNLMKNIITSVKDIIVKELYLFMMKQLKPLLELLIHKLALETIKYYKELIRNLIINCIPNFSWGRVGLNTAIDNVNYADIVNNTQPDNEQTTPELPC